MWTSLDRWTCPSCLVTEVSDFDDPDPAATIRAAQEEHAADHPAPPRAGSRS